MGLLAAHITGGGWARWIRYGAEIGLIVGGCWTALRARQYLLALTPRRLIVAAVGGSGRSSLLATCPRAADDLVRVVRDDVDPDAVLRFDVTAPTGRLRLYPWTKDDEPRNPAVETIARAFDTRHLP